MIRFKLNELLEARGWTAYRLAQESGIREDVIGKYRNNQVKRAVLANLSTLCVVLKCDLGELMEYVPDKPTKASKAPRGKKQ
jgi:putative transcriptional regulator